MLAKLALCATVLIFLSPLSSNAQATIPNNAPLYVFGDSLYDTGMGMYVDRGPTPANAWPYGETYFKRPAGRFSNGRLIPDFIAEFAKLALPAPYPKPNLKVTDYTQAINFANAAAGVLPQTRSDVHPLYLKLQVDYYVEMIQKLEKHYGQAQTKKLLSKAVHLFNIGANDYTQMYKNNIDNITPTLLNVFMREVVGNISLNLYTMYNKGARKFAFQAFAPMGCLPAFRLTDGSCNQKINSISRMHNYGFKALCKKLAQQLVGFDYSIYDFYTSLSSRLSNGASYGFTETKAACCGSGPFNGNFSCSVKKYKFTVCHNPSTHLWFDAGHPTQKADKQFAKEFWSGSTQLVKPRNVQSLFSS